MPFPKPLPIYANPSGDGRNLVELTPLYCDTTDGSHYRTIVGATTDGLSDPPICWSILPPNGGPWFLPAEFHDACWRCQIEQQMADGTWKRVAMSKESYDNIFYDMMIEQGVNQLIALAAYEAVSKLGEKAFIEDLAMPIQK